MPTQNPNTWAPLVLVLVGGMLTLLGSIVGTSYTKWLERKTERKTLATLLHASVKQEVKLAKDTSQKLKQLLDTPGSEIGRALAAEGFDILHKPDVFFEARPKIGILVPPVAVAVADFDFKLKQCPRLRDYNREGLTWSKGDIYKAGDNARSYIDGLNLFAESGQQLLTLLDKHYKVGE